MADPRTHGLKGLRLLIVEDEYTIASDLADALEAAGATAVGPTSSIAEALALVEAEQNLHGAVLDINLNGELVYPVADALRARSVPFVFATGYDARVIPAAYAEVPRYEKPVDTGQLARALSRHVTSSPNMP
ncbi:response regulator [Methylobacterium sp. CM6247]